jgi:hypothetical protein
MEYYSGIKKYEIISSAGKWMKLKIIMLTEVSQSEKNKYMFFLMCKI